MQGEKVFVAGTFDGMHKGHRFFLSRAFSVGRHVTIGLTSNQFVEKFKISNAQFSMKIKNFKLKIREYDERKRDLEQWLRVHGYKNRSTIVPIDDPFEPAASFEETGVLMVTPDNSKRGEEINQMRKKRGLVSLTLVEVPLVNAEDRQPISSSRVRAGDIDPEGRLVMPDSLRATLSQPMGVVYSGDRLVARLAEQAGKTIIAVGDVTTRTMLAAGVVPSLIIIDNKVGRKPYEGLAPWKKTTLMGSALVQSGPGYIAKEAIRLIKKWATPLKDQPLKGGRKAFVIEVDGEEDLLALPALVEAPVGSVLYYGQPPVAAWACGPVVEGVAEVEVTRGTKSEAKKLIGQFTAP